MSDSVSAMSSAMTKPSRASSMAGCEDLRERETARAVFLQRQCQPGDRAGHADAERGIARFIGVGLAVGSQKNIVRDRGRRSLAIVDGGVFVAPGRINHHEAAAADVSGARIGDGQRKAGGDRGIDRIAALPQDIGADLRGEPFLRHHHAVLGRDGANGGENGRCVSAALLRKGRRPEGKRKDDCGSHPAPSDRKDRHRKSAAVGACVTPGNSRQHR